VLECASVGIPPTPDPVYAPNVDAPPRRLPHLLPRAALAALLAPTYARSLSVDDDVALERLELALARPETLDGLHRGVAEAMREARGPRTSEDAQLDRLSAGLQKRRGRVRAAPATPGVAAVLVWLNLAAGLAPESMRATLAGGRGAELLEAGLRELGASLVKELMRP
jgi:hypothetical protein